MTTENEQLKDLLLLLQTEIKQTIDLQLEALAQLPQDSINQLGLQDAKQVSQLAFQLPMQGSSMHSACKIFQENVQKLKYLLSNVLSPINMIGVIRDVNQWAGDSQRAKGPTPYLTSVDDLKKFIRSNKCTCEFSSQTTVQPVH